MCYVYLVKNDFKNVFNAGEVFKLIVNKTQHDVFHILPNQNYISCIFHLYQYILNLTALEQCVMITRLNTLINPHYLHTRCKSHTFWWPSWFIITVLKAISAMKATAVVDCQLPTAYFICIRTGSQVQLCMRCFVSSRCY